MTLTEVLVALSLVGLLAVATLQYIDQGQRAWATAAARVESQQSARVAATRLVADVRAAGLGGAGFDAVALAEPQRVVLQRDLDADGAIAAAGERVTWRLAGSVLRRDAGGGAQPIINGVRAFVLRYFDAAGVPTTTPGEVRTIALTITAGPEHGTSSAASMTVATEVRLRNR